MIRRLIIFLVRRRLKLRKGERFRFANQKADNVYYFTSDRLIKVTGDSGRVSRREKSLVSLNWLLDEGCVIVKE